MRTGTLSEQALTHASYREYLADCGGDNSGFRDAFREAFLQALHEQLTERQFHILWLYEVEGLSGKEIAGKLGISPSAVSRHLSRGKRRLRALLEYNLAFRQQNVAE